MSTKQRDRDRLRPAAVPYGLQVAAAWSWRLLLISAMIYLIGRGFLRFQVLVVPVLISLLLVALVKPIHRAMARTPHRRGLPNSLAALLTLIFTLLVMAAVMALIGQQIATGFPSLREDAAAGLSELQRQLANGPLHLTSEQLNRYVQQVQDSLKGNSSTVVSSALSVTSTAERVLTGFFLVMFSSYFFLSGGDVIWGWVVRRFPREVRPRIRGAGVRAWITLTAFVRATVIVALVDGLGVGIGAAILGVPLALPLGVLVFIGAFVPIVGALVSGCVAVLVALVAVGSVKALIMLLIVVVVQQVEAHALQPFLLGRAVRVHPLAVILSITAGVLLAGIVGALFAVPLVAVINTVASYLAHPPEEASAPEEVAPEEAAPEEVAPEEAVTPEEALTPEESGRGGVQV